MTYNPAQHHRRSLRLDDYDYSSSGAYFLIICVEYRAGLFGDIVKDDMKLNAAGIMIESEWDALARRFPEVVLDQFIVMPNHIHGILGIAVDEMLDGSGESPAGPSFATSRGEPCVRPPSPTGASDEGEHEVRPYGGGASDGGGGAS